MSFQTWEPGAVGLSGVSVLTVSPNFVTVAESLRPPDKEMVITGSNGSADVVKEGNMVILFSPLYNQNGVDPSGFIEIDTVFEVPVRPATGMLFPRGDY